MSTQFARQLRKDPTEAELRLWSHLRCKQLDAFRFRRQQPLAIYVADFFCPEAGLIVEVDGGQHVDDSPARTSWLEARGYRVIRFWKNDVLANTDAVLVAIREALQSRHRDGGESPPSRRRERRRPPPQGGRRQEEGTGQ